MPQRTPETQFEGYRSNVVMVRVERASLNGLDDLVEASIMACRSETATFLNAEDVKAGQRFIDRIGEMITKTPQWKGKTSTACVRENEVISSLS